MSDAKTEKLDIGEAVFEPAYPISQITPASYNPRFLSDEAFGRLKESLGRFGVVKPVIVNGSGTIIAGHQRTKALTALGHTTVPAMVLNVQVHTHDEIAFNLLHNSIEEANAEVYVPKAEGREGFHYVDGREATVVDMNEGVVRANQCFQLISRYGTWGSIVAHPITGRVLLNSDYAAACAQARLPILVYYPPVEIANPLMNALAGEYGVYDATQVVDTPYNQNIVQPNRLRSGGEGSTDSSTLWRSLVEPRLNRKLRIMDFGAGHADFSKHYKSKGFDCHWYEPYTTTKTADGKALDVREVVRQIKDVASELESRGLFDMVVLDSVLNACPDDRYHEYVIRTCASLVSNEGLFLIGTRSLAAEERMMGAKKLVRGAGQRLTYMDSSHREISFHQGVFFTMKYHTPRTLYDALTPFFVNVEIRNTGATNLLAICQKPKPQNRADLLAALETEWNMPYPDDFRHNRQRRVVDALMKLNEAAGRITDEDVPEQSVASRAHAAAEQ